MKISLSHLRTRYRLVFLLTFLLCINSAFAEQTTSLGIYVNNSVPVPLKNYELAELRAIFAMKKKYWSDGSKIQVFVLPDAHPLHRQFSKKHLNMFPHQFRRIWDRMIFSGIAKAPKEVKDLDEMLYSLETTPGAIGYLKANTHHQKIRPLNHE
jgi:ABC-type phosphate transport system substrate-binding protein